MTSAVPKPKLPLSVHGELGKIETTTRDWLTNYVRSDPTLGFCSWLDMDKVAEIMLASAIEAFKARAAFYRAQSGFSQDWCEEAVTETIDGTFDLVPFALVRNSSFRQAAPDIRATLKTGLQTVLEASTTADVAGPLALDVPAKRKRGRPAKFPVEAKERALEAKREGASGKQVAATLYDTPRPTLSQIRSVHAILKNYERSKKS